MNHFDLNGKIAIVTGGHRGLGLGIATKLAQAGAEVVISGIMNQVGEYAAETLLLNGLKASYAHMDVRSNASIFQSIDGIVSHFLAS